MSCRAEFRRIVCVTGWCVLSFWQVLSRFSRPSSNYRRSVTAIAALAVTAFAAGAAPALAAEAPKAGRAGSGVASLDLSLDALRSRAGFFRFAGADVAPAPKASSTEWYNHFAPRTADRTSAGTFESPFDAVVRQAAVSPSKLARIFGRAEVASAGPAAGVFKKPVASVAGAPDKPTQVVAMAFADPSPAAENGALAAINNAIVPSDEEVGAGVDLGALLPDSIAVPLNRPKLKPDAQLEPGKQVKEIKVAALARPNNPAKEETGSGGGGFLKELFGSRPRAGNGVAVYDISAAKVYMPDGSVLEAHSGIGKMADNPIYTHVKMNGPTPAHTYNLRMREKRFHGVEAIRMLPVDGKNKFGRDGFLTHSYLLRNRPDQSHGCVAFKEYHKFLTAFKKGKVKKLIVVPGGGARVFARAG